MFEAVFASAYTIRVNIDEAAWRNMKKAQEKQKRVFDLWHLSSNVKVGDRVLFENKRRLDILGGKFSYRRLGPYSVKALDKNGLAPLVSLKDIVLKQKYNCAPLKPYIEYANEEVNAPDKNYKEQFDNVPDEKLRIEVVEQSIQEKIFWGILPNKLVERILHFAIETSTCSVSDYKCQTYRSILQTWCRSKMMEFSGKRFLPRLDIHPIDTLPKPIFNGKSKVSVQKITTAFGSASGVAVDIAQYADSNWRSDWLILSSQEHSSFIIDRVYTGENK